MPVSTDDAAFTHPTTPWCGVSLVTSVGACSTVSEG